MRFSLTAQPRASNSCCCSTSPSVCRWNQEREKHTSPTRTCLYVHQEIINYVDMSSRAGTENLRPKARSGFTGNKQVLTINLSIEEKRGPWFLSTDALVSDWLEVAGWEPIRTPWGILPVLATRRNTKGFRTFLKRVKKEMWWIYWNFYC